MPLYPNELAPLQIDRADATDRGVPRRWSCFVRTDHLDIVRLLDDAQDLTAILEALDDQEPAVQGAHHPERSSRHVRAPR